MTNRRSILWWILLALGSTTAVFLGRYPSTGFTSPGALRSDPLVAQVIVQLRMPRVLFAVVVGMSLGSAGWVFQTLFRNPLVEPGFLGVSPGAAFGAALAIVAVPGAGALVPILALIGAFTGLSASFMLARRLPYGGWIVRLVISGISVSALFTAGLGVLKYMADPARQLPELTFWMLGGLHAVDWNRIITVVPMVAVSLGLLVLFRWRINILSLDDRSAFSLGARPAGERVLLLAAASTAVAGVTAVAGIIGWIGLIVPHVVRRSVGADSRFGLPSSMAVGAIIVVLCDSVARIATTAEIPLGILTSLVGAALFIAFLSRGAVRIQR